MNGQAIIDSREDAATELAEIAARPRSKGARLGV